LKGTERFILGDTACAEGAIASGCKFFAGYPITPATEIAERMAERLPQLGGVYIQMEDEIASMAAVLGASWGGLKAMSWNYNGGTMCCCKCAKGRPVYRSSYPLRSG
jgi:2-oxoglutarate ferredoxin oxidoreductase subunit alpha